MEKRLDCAWVLRPVAERLGALQQSGPLPQHQAGSGIHRILMSAEEQNG
jgi:hypothetical protein